VACYVEGFGAGQLSVFAEAARNLAQRGARVLLHRAGRTEAGQAAAASHTGAMAGDITMERALLARCGVRFSSSIAEFDSALAWLSAYPRLQAGPVALLTNAGFESVNGSDLLGAGLLPAELAPASRRELETILGRHSLSGLVAPRLPLDLTPMAEEAAYLEAADLLVTECAVLVVGLVPFTRKLGTSGTAARQFASAFAAIARRHRKPLGIAVDAGPDYREFRAAFVAEGLACFDRVEDALLGLRALG
jgi:acetyltransferase